MTFSGNPTEAQAYYDWPADANATSATVCNTAGGADGTACVSRVSLLLNWGPIMYLPVVFVVMQRMNAGGDSVWWTLLAGALLTAAGAVVRVVPSLLGAEGSGWAVYCLHAGQILNGMAGPMMSTTPSAMSAAWFPPDQRAIATSIAYTPAIFGPGVGFFLAQFVTTSQSFQLLLYVQAAVSLAVTALWLCVPRLPRLPPSKTAAAKRGQEGFTPVKAHDRNSVQGIQVKAELPPFMSSMGSSCGNLSFMCLAVAGGLVSGVFNCWSSNLTVTLGGIPAGHPGHLSQSQLQGLSLGANISAFVGTLLIGPVADWAFVKRLKLLILGLFVLQFIGYVVFMLALPLASMEHAILPGLGENYGLLLAVLCVSSALNGASVPCFFELGAEMTYPSQEGISAGILQWLNNAGGLLVLAVSSVAAASHFTNALMVVTIVVGGVLVIVVEEQYRRSQVDDGDGLWMDEKSKFKQVSATESPGGGGGGGFSGPGSNVKMASPAQQSRPRQFSQSQWRQIDEGIAAAEQLGDEQLKVALLRKREEMKQKEAAAAAAPVPGGFNGYDGL